MFGWNQLAMHCEYLKKISNKKKRANVRYDGDCVRVCVFRLEVELWHFLS